MSPEELPLLPVGGYAKVASRLHGHQGSPPGFRTHRLGPKAIDCLCFVGFNSTEEFGYSSYRQRWQALCDRWGGDKVVAAKIQQLADRGYIDYGVAAVFGWLTDKGVQALADHAGLQR